MFQKECLKYVIYFVDKGFIVYLKNLGFGNNRNLCDRLGIQ